VATGDSRRVVVAALLANLGIALVKAVAAVLTSSGALLAETIHSLADSGNQALLLLGARRARRPADRLHPFGYGSERYFWAFVVALVLFALGALFSLYEGLEKLRHPVAIRSVGWAYGVLGASLVLEALSFRVARREVRRGRAGRTLGVYLMGAKDPAVPLVYLEDLGALLGLGLALLGVTLSHAFGWTRADGLATVGIGLLLGTIAAVLLVRCHRLLIGEGAGTEAEERIKAAVAEVAGVEEVVDLRTLHIGPEEVLVALDVRMKDPAATARRIEEAVRATLPAARYISVEPQ
jgi:cation diffusion facilitator family transporter